MKIAGMRDAGGRLMAFAWPSGYPLYYLAADGGVLCPPCANGANGSRAVEKLDPECPDDDQWRVVAGDVHWEGKLQCDHCGAEIESAYGIPGEK